MTTGVATAVLHVRAERCVLRRGLRLGLACYAALLRLVTLVRPASAHADRQAYEILLTGTFHSDNWIAAHLRPLALSRHCARIRMVATSPVPLLDKVEAVYPPTWLVRTVGGVPARLLTFLWTGLRTRPHVVGGLHLLLNGLAAALLARVIGARSIYFCVGGPTEVLGGGIASENRLFGRLPGPDRTIEARLVRLVAAFDCVIAMGTGAVAFFEGRGVRTRFHVLPGGLDVARIRAPVEPAQTDLILVGRLAPIKRVDRFLYVLRAVRERVPGTTATVVGDGPLRGELERLAAELGLGGSVRFVGQQRDVGPCLARAKIFVLTSDSEGLSLALMEAMLCGLPAVVPRVGDLADLVEDGVNGHLVADLTPEAFAGPIVGLLRDPDRRARLAAAARERATRHEAEPASRRWDTILAELGRDRLA